MVARYSELSEEGWFGVHLFMEESPRCGDSNVACFDPGSSQYLHFNIADDSDPRPVAAYIIAVNGMGEVHWSYMVCSGATAPVPYDAAMVQVYVFPSSGSVDADYCDSFVPFVGHVVAVPTTGTIRVTFS